MAPTAAATSGSTSLQAGPLTVASIHVVLISMGLAAKAGLRSMESMRSQTLVPPSDQRAQWPRSKAAATGAWKISVAAVARSTGDTSVAGTGSPKPRTDAAPNNDAEGLSDVTRSKAAQTVASTVGGTLWSTLACTSSTIA